MGSRKARQRSSQTCLHFPLFWPFSFPKSFCPNDFAAFCALPPGALALRACRQLLCYWKVAIALWVFPSESLPGVARVMNIAHVAKRIFLLVMVNILVMATITVVLGLLRVGNYFPTGGLAGLAVFCLVWGFAGAFISLALSRFMAKWMMGVQVIPPDTSDPALRELVETV